MRGWLPGRDLNPRPLGYEPNLSMARLCLSMIYVDVDLRFSTLFWGILFSICSSSCSRILAQRWPNYVGHQTREKSYGSDLPIILPSNLYNCCGSYRHAAIPHPRLEVREIVSSGGPEAVGQIRIGMVGGAGRENMPGEVGPRARGAQPAARPEI